MNELINLITIYNIAMSYSIEWSIIFSQIHYQLKITTKPNPYLTDYLVFFTGLCF